MEHNQEYLRIPMSEVIRLENGLINVNADRMGGMARRKEIFGSLLLRELERHRHVPSAEEQADLDATAALDALERSAASLSTAPDEQVREPERTQASLSDARATAREFASAKYGTPAAGMTETAQQPQASTPQTHRQAHSHSDAVATAKAWSAARYGRR